MIAKFHEGERLIWKSTGKHVTIVAVKVHPVSGKVRYVVDIGEIIPEEDLEPIR